MMASIEAPNIPSFHYTCIVEKDLLYLDFLLFAILPYLYLVTFVYTYLLGRKAPSAAANEVQVGVQRAM